MLIIQTTTLNYHDILKQRFKLSAFLTSMIASWLPSMLSLLYEKKAGYTSAA